MTLQEIKENNEKIARFIGWKEQTDPKERFFGSFRDEYGKIWRNSNTEPLLFHSDWNWLMQVVKKLNELPEAYDYEEFLQLRDGLPNADAERTYKDVIFCLKWYESTKLAQCR